MKTLLVVDEDPMVLATVQVALSPLPVQVIGVSTTAAARDMMSAWPPDIVMLSMTAGDDALTLCRELRAARTAVTIPVIVLTKNVDLATKVRWLQAGAIDFLAKPLEAALVRAHALDHMGDQRKSGPLSLPRPKISPEQELAPRLAAALTKGRSEGHATTLALVNLASVGRLNALYGNEKVDELLHHWKLGLSSLRSRELELFDRTPVEVAAVLSASSPDHEREILQKVHGAAAAIRDLPFAARARMVALRTTMGGSQAQPLLVQAQNALRYHHRPTLIVVDV